ncbi:sacsin N-terminal ATP-binding-like domain-containing protein [Cellulosimicrobium protaetiae]
MKTFDELVKDRRDYVEAARANGFEDGIRKLLADLYPDNAHFIYELLQNAEDAGARQVAFDLREDGLRVEHDGTRLFTLDDITSITGISQSTKDEGTKIGKFGVGFKSVFAYTSQPVVLSGEFTFAIRDMFVPEPLDQGAKDGWTTFWFPFDRPDKPIERARSEVARGLRDLTPESLLFLTSISSVQCTLPDGDVWIMARTEAAEGLIALSTSQQAGGDTHWYRLTDIVKIDGHSVPIAVAFALQPARSTRKSREKGQKSTEGAPVDRNIGTRYTIAPTQGRVFIYFPAASEDSGLQFHIHAAFATTVARDAIRDAEGNDRIIAAIGRLMSGSLPTMREQGLITDGLLAALPNDRDRLSDRYASIRTEVVEAFSSEALTPAWQEDGGKVVYEPSESLLRSTQSIRRALSLDDANLLREIADEESFKDAVGWLRGSSNARAREFLDSLEAISFDGAGLNSVLRGMSSWWGGLRDQARADLIKWISDKDDAWVRRLYALLGGIEEFDQIRLPLVRVVSGGEVAHVEGASAFLPTAPGADAEGAEQLVPDSLAYFASSEARDNDALREFFRRVRAKDWDAAAALDARLAGYSTIPAKVTEGHLRDLRDILSQVRAGTRAVRDFAERRFLVGVAVDGSRTWMSPSASFIDDSAHGTGLGSLYESNSYAPRFTHDYEPYGPLSDGTETKHDKYRRIHYKEKVRLDPTYADYSEVIDGLVSNFGLSSGLSVVKQHPTWNPQFNFVWLKDAERDSHLALADDWDLPWLDLICDIMDEQLLREVWRLVCALPRSKWEGVYRKNGRSPERRMESAVLQRLRETAWILDRDGNLRTPAEAATEDLAEGMPMPLNTAILDKLGFGADATEALAVNERRRAAAREFGFDDPDVARMLGDAAKDPDTLREMLALVESRTKLPEMSSVDPDGRAARVGAGAASSPRRRTEKRQRAVRIQEPGHLSKARAYLRNFYTNDDGVMICQICTNPMPFKVNDEPYFEAVQFVRDAGHDLESNRLALCPTCSAKYRHALGTPLADLRDDLLSVVVGAAPSVEISLVAAGTRSRLRFVGAHAIDLQAELRATFGTPIEEDREFLS